jgi:hypothetical protein
VRNKCGNRLLTGTANQFPQFQILSQIAEVRLQGDPYGGGDRGCKYKGLHRSWGHFMLILRRLIRAKWPMLAPARRAREDWGRGGVDSRFETLRILLASWPSLNFMPSRPPSRPPATGGCSPSRPRREAEDGCTRPNAPVQLQGTAIQGPGQRVGRELDITESFLDKLAEGVRKDLGVK